MSERPFIKFYPSDFLAGTSGLSPAERGIYITLLCLIFENDGPITRDDGRLARRCGAPKAGFKKALDALIAEGKITQDGDMLSNRRAEKAIVDRQNRSQNGTHAINQRWRAQRKKIEQNQGQDDTGEVPEQYAADTSQNPEPDIGGGGGGARARESGPPDDDPPTCPDLRVRVMEACRVPEHRMPTYWMPPAADLHVRRWLTDLGLTEAEVVHVAKQHNDAAMHSGRSPPNGPKALDRAMADYAAAKAAPPMQIPEQPHGPRQTGHRRNDGTRGQRAVAEAGRAIAEGRITSIVGGAYAPGASRRRRSLPADPAAGPAGARIPGADDG